VYSSCLFCAARLGANDALEHFPVGRRLAFDPEKGRLWAVCRACAQWNLAPLEERWEALETCERLFRETRLRTSTPNIGLARHRSGLDLVRIGRPLRPEFAAWRYGPRLTRRRRHYLVGSAALAATAGAVVFGGLVAGVLSAYGAQVAWNLGSGLRNTFRRQRIVARALSNARVPIAIRERELPTARIVRREPREGSWVLRLDHPGVTLELSGNEALRVAGLVLARVNARGATAADVRAAAERLDWYENPAAAFATVASSGGPENGVSLTNLFEAERLTLEMAAHDESERRAMEGELASLEAAWRTADELAAIADNVLLPPVVNEMLARYKERRQNPNSE